MQWLPSEHGHVAKKDQDLAEAAQQPEAEAETAEPEGQAEAEQAELQRHRQPQVQLQLQQGQEQHWGRWVGKAIAFSKKQLRSIANLAFASRTYR